MYLAKFGRTSFFLLKKHFKLDFRIKIVLKTSVEMNFPSITIFEVVWWIWPKVVTKTLFQQRHLLSSLCNKLNELLYQNSPVPHQDHELGRGSYGSTREVGDRLWFKTVIKPLLVNVALARHWWLLKETNDFALVFLLYSSTAASLSCQQSFLYYLYN